MQIGNLMTSDAVTFGRSRPVPVVDYRRLVGIRRDSYLDLLTRLKSLSWLSAAELAALAAQFARTSFKRNQVVLRNAELESEAHILLKGIVRVTCLNVRAERVTIALIAPGPIPQFPRISFGPAEFKFQYEAYSDCSIGSLAWEDFERITAENSTSAGKSFHENDLKQWYRLLLRSSSYLNRDLDDRIAATLLDLCADFGIEESRGTMLRVSFSHRVIASLVSASRSRITEHLNKFERDNLIIRQGRQIIVRTDQLAKYIGKGAACVSALVETKQIGSDDLRSKRGGAWRPPSYPSRLGGSVRRN